ncbi:hypothetical protein MMC30_001174 [Trapelia coarctata]|nr:hypothetical protein [Trapelia coarctata]
MLGIEQLPSLRPIVIEPLKWTLGSKAFTCSGDGLLKDGIKYDPSVQQYLPLLEPKRTKKGTIAVHQPYIKKQTLPYWKAQCVFRGLPQTGTVAKLQEALRYTEATLHPDLAAAEKRLNDEFRRKNAIARDEKWNKMETPEEKAEVDTCRYLLEQFGSSQGNSDPAVVIKTHQRPELHEAAEKLGLQHESVDAPRKPDGSRPNVDRWIVIGRSRSSVMDKIREVSRETQRTKQALAGAKADRTRKLNEEVVSNSKNAARGGKWDVTGSWVITCPYMEEQWGRGEDGCSLQISSRVIDGRKQMWASFDFIAITGIFRFIATSPPGGSQRTQASKSSKQPAHSDNDEEDEDEEEDEGYEEDEEDDSEDTPTPEEFYLTADDPPSPSHPTWNYRWRGEETGEGEIQLYSDEKLCSITFSGVGGTKLRGTFDSDLTGRIEFTGLKTGIASSAGGDPDYKWSSMSESAYEPARVGRWHQVHLLEVG